jgi:signal transduction histidine kinase
MSEGARLTGRFDPGRFDAGRFDAGRFDRLHLVVVWTVWALACATVMFVRPGQETIPYHLGWAGFALAFGLGTWTRWQLVTALAWYTLATGAALERSWLLGRIEWEETTEIPLMFLLALMMVWHVRRRQATLDHITRLAARDIQASHDRAQLMQLTSHELRTPLTIAQGYIELLQTRPIELENQSDLSVVADELKRLSRVSDRLIRMIQLQEDPTSEIVDIDEVMAQAVERWRVVADRQWILDVGAGRALGSPERLRTGLDTLVENAIRYTSEGDTIRLAGSRRHEQVFVGVFDSGVGFSDQQIMAINAGEESSPASTTVGTVAGVDTTGSLRGTGLGLSIVRALAHARGGTLHASHAPEGGAAMVISFPLHLPNEVAPFVRGVASDSLPVRSAALTERGASRKPVSMMPPAGS